MSILTNQTAVNTQIDFFGNGGEFANSSALFLKPNQLSTSFSIPNTGVAQPIAAGLGVPSAFSSQDNFLFSATFNITNIAYPTTPSSGAGYIVFQVSFNNSTKIFNSSTPLYLNYASYNNTAQVSVVTLMANTGTPIAGGVNISLVNNTNSTVTFNYTVTNITFQKVNSGGSNPV